MCGRKTLTKSKLDIIRDLSIDKWDDLIEYEPNYNIAPTQQHPIIIQDNDKRIIKKMNWGLIPNWEKDQSFASKMINARQETLSEKPAFRDLINSKRCLIPIDGYYEWKNIDGQKQPFYIFNVNHKLFCLAGLWSSWKKSSGDVLNSYTVITTKADNKLNHIHHRMPVIQTEKTNDWLDTSHKYNEFNFTNIETNLEFYPVSPIVNSFQNNSEDCIIESEIIHQNRLF